jgi:hypothetical protein
MHIKSQITESFNDIGNVYAFRTSALCSVVIENVHTLDTHFPTHSHWRGLRLGGVTTVWLSSVCGSWSCVA